MVLFGWLFTGGALIGLGVGSLYDHSFAGLIIGIGGAFVLAAVLSPFTKALRRIAEKSRY